MEDIKKIQEFFSKPLEELKQLDNTDFTKVVKAVEQTGHPVTVLLVPKFNEIEVLTGMDAPDDMIRDLSNAIDSLGYGRNDIIIAGDSSNLSRREYSDIFRVNGGHQDYFEESVNEMDMNDPVLMRMRAAKDKLAKMRAANAGDDGNDKFFDNAKKIAFLKKERAQLMRDMEQEAEPEGGPIADEYGSKLNRIDAAIAKLEGRKEMTYDQAIAEDQTYSSTFGGSSKKLDGRKIKMEIVKSGYDIIPTDIWNRILVGKDGKRVGMVNTDEGYYNVDGKMYKWVGTPDFIDHIESKNINENDSYARVSMPRFVKDKNNPNFLNVYIDYNIGPGGASMALGKETMTGQIRRLSAAKAMRLAGDVARDLEAEYNLEDIEITDLKNGKVRIFAVSDDFIDMNPNMLGEIKEAIGGSHVFQYFANRGYVVKDRRPDGYPKKEGVEGFQVTDRKDSGRRSDNPQTVIFQYNKDTDQFTISQMNGYKIDQGPAIKAGMRQRGMTGVAGIDSYITDGNYNPVNISAEGLIDIVDHVMGGLSREAKAQKDFYADRGPTSGTIDEKEDKNKKPLSKPIAKDLGKMKTNFNDLKKRLKLESLNPEVSNALNRFIKAMAKRYNYSEQDAVYAIMAALKQRDFDGLNEATRQDLGMVTSVSKRRAGAELKQKLAGKRSDGMGKYDGKIYGLDNDGKRVELKSLNDLNKFTKFELDADLNEAKKYNQEELLKLDLIAHRKFDCDFEKCTDEQKAEVLKDKVKVGVAEKVIAQLKEEKPGLWANIRAKKARGEKPAHGNSDAHKTAVKAGKKINKLNENGEDQFAAELDGFADQLAAEIKDELEDHKEEIQKSDKELNEAAVTVGIIGYILLSNTVANMLSKFAKNQFAKHNFGKGEEAAKKIYDFTHKNEEAFKAPIRRIVGIFTKDEKKKKIISDILYAIVIFLMAGQAGGEAVAYLKKASYLKGGIAGLKAAIKGTEVATILKGAVSDAVS